MAFAHVYFNDQTPHGRQLRRMLNGDGSQDAHYAEVTSKFGFASDAKARAAFEELDSAFSKTSGNGSVSNVRAARDQLFAKLR